LGDFARSTATIWILALAALPTQAQEKRKANYQDDLTPIFRESCFGCHNADKAKGGLNLAGYATMIVLGHRGGPALRTSLPGSVSRSVVAHCERPVVVVPCEREPRHYTSDAARKAFAQVAEHAARDHHDALERAAHQEAARRAELNPRRGVRP